MIGFVTTSDKGISFLSLLNSCLTSKRKGAIGTISMVLVVVLGLKRITLGYGDAGSYHYFQQLKHIWDIQILWVLPSLGP